MSVSLTIDRIKGLLRCCAHDPTHAQRDLREWRWATGCLPAELPESGIWLTMTESAGSWPSLFQNAYRLGCEKTINNQGPMLLQTILNRCHRFESFVYRRAAFANNRIEVDIVPRKNSRGRCAGCQRRGPAYDTSRQVRPFEFVPLWGFQVFWLYRMRRIDCAKCGKRSAPRKSRKTWRNHDLFCDLQGAWTMHSA